MLKNPIISSPSGLSGNRGLKQRIGNGTWEIEKWKVVVSVHTKSRPIYLSIINYIVTTSKNFSSAITMQHNGRRSWQALFSSRKILLVQLSLVKIADGYLTINLNL